VFLKLSRATDPPLNIVAANELNFVGTADLLPKTFSYIFIKHSRLTKINNDTNIIINWEPG
jgi:hypothetical protein